MTAPVALPVLGDVMRYTVTPLAGRALLGSVAKAMFAPDQDSPAFFPVISREMMLRPVQLRANAEDAAFVMPAAKALSRRYGELRLPMTLINGTDDKVINGNAHAVRLHDECRKPNCTCSPALATWPITPPGPLLSPRSTSHGLRLVLRTGAGPGKRARRKRQDQGMPCYFGVSL